MESGYILSITRPFRCRRRRNEPLCRRPVDRKRSCHAVRRAVEHVAGADESYWAACGDRAPVRIAGSYWTWKDEELVFPAAAESAPPEKILTVGEIKKLAYRAPRLR